MIIPCRLHIDKAKLAGELQEGIAKEQFKVYYQPVIDTKTGKIASVEALIRWIHPDKGFISPALFIPALEENGHISELDFYVLKKVWQFINDRCENNKFVVPISVNLSWMDFYDEIMMEKILKEMDRFRKMAENIWHVLKLRKHPTLLSEKIEAVFLKALELRMQRFS